MGTRREQRLRHRRDISAVYRRGLLQRGELVLVRALRTDLLATRFGFAVPATVGNAVRRNRVRRRLREILRQLPVGAGWDLMVTARPGAREATFEELRRGVELTLARAGILSE